MEGVLAILCIFVVLPWIIFHYVTKWKGRATLTNDDEQLLQDLYEHARRLDDRIVVIERIAAAENPEWTPGGRLSAPDDRLERLEALERGRTTDRRI